MNTWAASLVATLLLSACADGQGGAQNGTGVSAPSGFVAYCANHPERDECGGVR